MHRSTRLISKAFCYSAAIAIPLGRMAVANTKRYFKPAAAIRPWVTRFWKQRYATAVGIDANTALAEVLAK
jgi:hypothetical protein